MSENGDGAGGAEQAVCPECGHVSSFNSPGDTVYCPDVGTTVELVERAVCTRGERDV